MRYGRGWLALRSHSREVPGPQKASLSTSPAQHGLHAAVLRGVATVRVVGPTRLPPRRPTTAALSGSRADTLPPPHYPHGQPHQGAASTAAAAPSAHRSTSYLNATGGFSFRVKSTKCYEVFVLLTQMYVECHSSLMRGFI